MIPKAMQEAFVGINMCGGAVTFAVLLRLFRAADLRWEMHPAQLFSIEAQKKDARDREIHRRGTAKEQQAD